MTFEQAQLCIRLFILQHYDENVEDVIPNVKHQGKVSDLVVDEEGDYGFVDEAGEVDLFVFWGRYGFLGRYGRVGILNENNDNSLINIIDYILPKVEQV